VRPDLAGTEAIDQAVGPVLPLRQERPIVEILLSYER
jgi:hypothetical protein